MAQRTRTEAIDAYVSQVQRFISCVSRDILRTHGSYQAPNATLDVLLAGGRPVRLHGPARIQPRVRLRLRLAQVASPRGYWEAETAAYEYRLSDADDGEILAYHWQPEGQSHVQTPHLHLGAAAEIGRAALLAAHLPTGQVPVQDVLRLAIESFDVQPQRRDWNGVLRASSAT